MIRREVREGGTPSPTRETRALPVRRRAEHKHEQEDRTSNIEHPTPNAERRGKRSGLRGRAAEGTGERRSDVGGDDDLLGRFLRLHFFAAARSDPRRWIQHPAVLDDFLDLRTVESLELEQRFGDD